MSFIPQPCIPGGGGAVDFTVLDTASIDLTLTGTGTAGDPFVLSADVAGGGAGLLDHQGPLIAAIAPYSPQWYIDRADFVVDPLAFDFETAFNAAIALVDGTSVFDGAIYIAPGLYIASSDLDAGRVSVYGMGNAEAITLYLSGCLFQTTSNLANMTIGAAGTAFGAAGFAAGTQISLFSDVGIVYENIRIILADTGLTDTLLEVQTSSGNVVSGLRVTPQGLFDTTGGNPAVLISGGDGSIRDSHFESGDDSNPDLRVSITADGAKVIDNDFLGFTVEVAVQQVLVGRNRVSTPGGNGIHVLSGVTRTRIFENYIARAGFAATGGHAGIFDEGNETQGQLNTVRDDLGNADYGYSVGAAANDAFVTNNDLRDSGSIASFNDAGTGTITIAGNAL